MSDDDIEEIEDEVYSELYPDDIYDDLPEVENPKAQQYFEMYDELFSRTCFNHPLLSFATFHMLIGSLSNVRTLKLQKGKTLLDPRMHVFYISPSASGKGAGINFTASAGREAGLSMQSCGKITANALTGTREKVDKPVAKEGSVITDFDKWAMTDGYLNPDAMPSNIVFFTEAAKLITTRPNRDMEECLDHFQKAMNPLGTEDSRISKKTALGPEITFFPNASLFFTTYKPAELAEVVTQRGFLQRCLFLVRESTIDERFEDIEQVIRNTGQDDYSTASISDLLKAIDDFYANKPRIMTIEEGIQDVAVGQIKYYKRILLNCTDYIQERLIDFIPRFNDIYWKVAMQSAILRMDTVVREEDISYAHLMLHEKFLATLSFLSRNIPTPPEVLRQQQITFRKVQKVLEAAHTKTGKKYFALDKVAQALVRRKIFISLPDAKAYMVRLARHGVAEITKDRMCRLKRNIEATEGF